MNKFEKRILNNGIPVYFVKDPSMVRIIVSYNVSYGSSGLWFNFNNDGKDYHILSGYAHYLEHLLGEHCKYGNMYDNFKHRMQSANAFTSSGVTSYHFKGLIGIEESLSELVHSIEEPVFDSKDVDISRNAIEEEAASLQSNHEMLLQNMVERNLYSGLDLYDDTLSPIGNRETTLAITTETLYDCYNAFYTDDKKFFIIAGDIEEEKIMEQLNSIYSTITPHKSSLVLPNIDFSGIRKKEDILYRDIDSPLYTLGVKIKKPQNMSIKKFYYYLLALENYLLDSKQYSDLNNKGIIDSIEGSELSIMDDYVAFLQTFITEDRDTCVGNLLEILSKKEITPKEYELAQKDIIATEIRCMDDKYDYLEGFPENLDYTEEYCDADFYRSIGYNEFMDAIDSCSFDTYSLGEIKKLRRRKK